MTIDPRIAFWFGVWTSVLLLVASGTVNLTGALPDLWVPVITKWCAILGAINSTILTAASGYSSNKSGPMVNVPAPAFTPKVVNILLVAFALSFLVAGGEARAAQLKQPFVPAVTGNLPADIQADHDQLFGKKVAAGVTKNADGTISCSFSIFAHLTPENLVDTIKSCVNDQKKEFADDVDTALVSAQTYNSSAGDKPAIQCLEPGSAIIHAAISKPAVAAVDAVPAQPATATSAAVPAVAAVAAKPAYNPGLVTLFQKYREFTLSGGINACNNWVTQVTNATLAGAAGTVGSVAGVAAGAAILSPVK